MGDPKKPRKKWERPGHPWIRARLEEELRLLGEYGLRNKRELWRAQTLLRRLRERARSLLALPPEVRAREEAQLVQRLYNTGLLRSTTSTLDDILGISISDVLERRLQTIVYRKGLAKSMHHARQLIAHGHVLVGGRRVTSPGHLVSRSEEELIALRKPVGA